MDFCWLQSLCWIFCFECAKTSLFLLLLQKWFTSKREWYCILFIFEMVRSLSSIGRKIKLFQTFHISLLIQTIERLFHWTLWLNCGMALSKIRMGRSFMAQWQWTWENAYFVIKLFNSKSFLFAFKTWQRIFFLMNFVVFDLKYLIKFR